MSKPQLVYSPTKGCLVSEIKVINLVCANTLTAQCTSSIILSQTIGLLFHELGRTMQCPIG